MADRIVEESAEDIPEIPEVLEKVLLYALEEAKEKLQGGEELVPFTSLVVGDNLFIESHPADDVEKCFALAKHTVEGARGAKAYAFCYDGYVDVDDGQKDAIISEGGIPGEPQGVAIAYFYEQDEEGAIQIMEEPIYLGPAPNFMWKLAPGTEATEETSKSEATGDTKGSEEPSAQ